MYKVRFKIDVFAIAIACNEIFRQLINPNPNPNPKRY
jgi:hypothetical protein